MAKNLLTYVSIAFATVLLTGTGYAQLTWDPDGDGVSNGGNGLWDVATTPNWGSGITTWTNGSNAIFGSNGSPNIVNIASGGVGVGNITLVPPSGTGKVQFIADVDGEGLSVGGAGATWDLGGRELEFTNLNDANDTTLDMTSGGTLTIISTTGGGTFDTGERPGGAGTNWDVLTATLDFQADILRGNAASVGQFSQVIMADGSTFIQERNSNQGFANDWLINGDVTFDNRFAQRSINANGVVSGPGRIIVQGLASNANNDNGSFRINNTGNTFSGGITIDGSVNNTLALVYGGDGTFGSVPGSFDADYIILKDGGVLKMNGFSLNANRGITLQGSGGVIVNNSGVNTINGAITGEGGLTIGRAGDGSQNVTLLNSNSNDYQGDTRVLRGTLRLGVDNALPASTLLNIGGASGGNISRFDLNGNDVTVGGVFTSGSNTREIQNNGGSASTLTINVADPDVDYTYNANWAGADPINVVKDGPGQQTIDRVGGATNTPASWTVAAGRLRVASPQMVSTNVSPFDTVTVQSGGEFVVDASDTAGIDDYTEAQFTQLLTNSTFQSGSFIGINTSAGEFTFSGDIGALAGTGVGLIKANQNQTVTLTGTQTSTAPTLIEQGPLVAATNTSLPNGDLTVEDGGYVGFVTDGILGGATNPWTELQIATRINAPSTTFEPGAGVLFDLSDESNFTYGSTLPANVDNLRVIGEIGFVPPDTLTLGASYSFDGTIELTDAGIDFNGNNTTAGGLTGDVDSQIGSTGSATLTFNTPEGVVATFNGSTAGSLNIVKQGPGNQVLLGPNSYTGTTTVNEGRLRLGQTIANNGGVTVNSGGDLALDVTDTPGDNWEPSEVASLLSAATFNTGSKLTLRTVGDFTPSAPLTGDYTLRVEVVGNSFNLGAGNSYTGDTELAGGIHNLNAVNAIPVGSVLTIGEAEQTSLVRMNGNNQTIGGLVAGGSGGGNRQIFNHPDDGNDTGAAATLTIDVGTGEVYDYTHQLGLPGATDLDSNNFTVIKNGDGAQSVGMRHYTGGTEINAGLFNIAGNGSVATGAVNVASGATLSGGGRIGGDTTLAAGSILSIGNDALFNPASTLGELNFESTGPANPTADLDISALTSTNSGGLVFELGSAAQDIVVWDDMGILNVGTLDITDFTLTDAGDLADGTYTLFDSQVAITGTIGASSGSFSNFDAAISFSGDGTDLLVTISNVVSGLVGDFNDDGVVDLADYTIWRNNLGSPESALPPGTGDGSGTVDEGDYTAWRGNYGATAPLLAASNSPAAVPEPSAIVLGLGAIGGFAVINRLRRRKNSRKGHS